MKGRTQRTPKKLEKFLAELRKGLSVTTACEAQGIGRSTAYEWRETDPGFKAAWDQAIESGTDMLEDVAIQRAAAGSDVLTIFLLKARRPERFKDRAHVEHTGAGGGPIETADVTTDRDRAKAVAVVLAKAKTERPAVH